MTQTMPGASRPWGLGLTIDAGDVPNGRTGRSQTWSGRQSRETTTGRLRYEQGVRRASPAAARDRLNLSQA